MAGEEPSDESELIDQEASETDAHQTGGSREITAELWQAITCVGERHRHGHGHAHHPEHRATAEDNKVNNGPDWFVNGREHEQGDSSRAGEAMHQADG